MTKINTHSDPKALETLRLFRIIIKSATRHFAEVEKSTSISGASLWALAEISGASDLTVNGLADAMSIHQSTASNLLEKLEKGGCVVKHRSGDDKRVVKLSLTDKGRSILANAPQPYRGLLLDALMRLDEKALDRLRRDLKKLVGVLDKKHKDGAFELLGS
jgi:DNA-binding MarR family transcriptional regulator